MIINITDQVEISPALPLRKSATFVASSVPVAIVGVPVSREDGTVTGVTAILTNADGAPVSASCTKGGDGLWRTAFASSCFPTFGYVTRGVKIVATLTDGAVTRTSTLAVGDLEIIPDTASARPGDPSNAFQTKGGDIYIKSTIVGEVQHYKRQQLVFDDEMQDWGLVWTGDYILINGDFQEVTL